MSTLRPGRALAITVPAIERYLTRRHGPVTNVRVSELGQSTQETLKDYGYGRPLRIDFEVGGAPRTEVLRTMSADPFGHDRRADRVGSMVLDFDTFGRMPRHIHPLDVGCFEGEELVSMGRGEAWLVTDYVEGELYARDLKALQHAAAPSPLDLARAAALAGHLAEVHSAAGDDGLPGQSFAQNGAQNFAWVRAIRDTIGSGEGIFGLTDSYPDDHPVATRDRLMRLEQAAVAWRWGARDHVRRRARRTHGDFHPFNILFREGVDLTALDCSRGAIGEPADDVCCLSINYLFFRLAGGAQRFDGALRVLWDHFWGRYLEVTRDHEVRAMVAPFFAWRALVVASPLWYPHIADEVRERLFVFAERLLGGHAFAPDRVDELL